MQNTERIAIVSLDPRTETVRVHEFEGEYRGNDGAPFINLYGIRRQRLERMSVQGFLDFVLLSTFQANWNKHAAIAKLNTWWWAAVVGDNGGIRRRPKLFRHTTPGGDPAFWVLQKNRRRGYRLSPFKGPFECRCCSKQFERYKGQTRHDKCRQCASLYEEMASLVHEGEEKGTISEERTAQIETRIAEIDQHLSPERG